MVYIVTVILAIFTIASIFYQVKRFQTDLGKFDKLRILPNYSFFAPKPLTHDYRLVYKIIDGEGNDWIEVPVYKRFNLLRLIWNPFKYYNKGMIDIFHFLLKEFNVLENKKFVQVSSPYINILSIISRHLNRSGKREATIRFAILSVEYSGMVKIKNVVFASYNQII